MFMTFEPTCEKGIKVGTRLFATRESFMRSFSRRCPRRPSSSHPSRIVLVPHNSHSILQSISKESTMFFSQSTVLALVSIIVGVSSTKFSINDETVHPGGCFLGDELIHCAIEESHCNGLMYASHRQMVGFLEQFGDEQNGGDNPQYDEEVAAYLAYTVRQCAGDHTEASHSDFVGMCTSPKDGFHCTSHASNCALSDQFVHNVPYCSLRYNYFPDRDAAVSLYGSCIPIDSQTGKIDHDNVACVWSIDDCPGVVNQTYAYMGAGQYNGVRDGVDSYDGLCTCDKVMTGACVDKNGRDTDKDYDWFTCSVSADACDGDSVFLPWQEVQASGRECRLCDSFEKDKDVPMGNMRHSYSSMNAVVDQEHKAGCENGGGSGEVAGIVIGGMLAGALLLVLGMKLKARRTSKTGKEFDTAKDAGDMENVDFQESGISS